MKLKTTSRRELCGLVFSASASDWVSCRSIVPNLQAAYGQVLENAPVENYYMNSETPESIPVLAAKIFQDKPQKLIFIDHRPHPRILLEWIVRLYGARPLPELVFHIFGDFTYYAREWFRAELPLKKFKIKFICASDRHSALLSRFLSGEIKNVFTCPFPVDTEAFGFSGKTRATYRTELGIFEKEKVLTYTGRLSLQKNVLRLVREFLLLNEKSDPPVKLIIAGTFDDLGAPFFGITASSGSYFQQWSSLMATLSPSQKKKIVYLGHLGTDELRKLYNASDLFTSLSLHHDEDFGMSPAEALCCGVPLVLTDWGGYASFSEKESSSLIAVHLNKSGLSLSSALFQDAVNARIATDETDAQRKTRSHFFAQRYSIAGVATQLTNIFAEPKHQFAGFNWRLEKFVSSGNRDGIPLARGPKKDTFYEEIYGVYSNSIR